MSRRNLFFLGAATAVFLVVFVAWGMMTSSSDTRSPDDSGDPNALIVYYYGKECSHCKNLEKFLEENNIAEKVSFAKKEVWHNKKNSSEMKKRATECGLKEENQIGVPLVWADGKCLVGGPDAEKFFREKAGI